MFCFPHEISLFQVIQLTTLLIRGPSNQGEKIILSFDRVAIKEEEVRNVLQCVQDFVRSPHFTQRSFFSESGLTLLSESAAIADSITYSLVYAPWIIVESACPSQVITDLRACWERVLLRRRLAKDPSERWYQGSTPRNETASRPGVKFSDIVEEAGVEYVPLVLPSLGPPGPSKIRSSPSKRKTKISRNPMKLPRRLEISSPPASPKRRSIVEDPSLASTLAAQASRGKSRLSGRDRRAGSVLQKGSPKRQFCCNLYFSVSPSFFAR